MKRIDLNRKEFLIDECLLFSFSAAFQTRNKSYPIYKKKEILPWVFKYKSNYKDKIKVEVHDFLKDYLKRIKAQKINEQAHIQKICEFSVLMTQKFDTVLHNNRFRIGVSQKLINLFLKYMWAMGEIPEPYHCPIDGIVKKHIEKQIDNAALVDWTKLDRIEDYKRYIDLIKQLAAKQHLSVAAWELSNWHRQ